MTDFGLGDGVVSAERLDETLAWHGLDSTADDAPVTMWDGVTRSLEACLEVLDEAGCRPGQILWRFGDWAVTDDGVECLSHPYFIEKGGLGEDWEDHLAGKTWPNMPDVCKALGRARDHHGAAA